MTKSSKLTALAMMMVIGMGFAADIAYGVEVRRLFVLNIVQQYARSI